MREESTLLERLADWIAGLQAPDLPPEVLAKARLCLLDYVGVALAADRLLVPSTRAAATQLVDMLAAEDAARDCLVLGFPARLSAPNAALVNSFLGFSVSLDDTALRSMSHPGCAVIPATLAMAERLGRSGTDVLVAIVAGYETAIRVGRAIMPAHARRGFHVTSITAPFGAAAAAARLLGLDRKAKSSALAIAGNLGAGLQEQLFRAQAAGKLAVGRSVQGGVLGALLAAGGMEGAPAFLEGPEGFFRAMSDEVHPELVLRELGGSFEIIDVGFKFHAGCRHWHAAADAAIALRRLHGLSPDAIRSVRVHTYSEAIRMNIDQPGTVDEARFCAPFALAQALLGHDLIGGDLYSERELTRTEARAIMEGVEHVLDSGFESRYPSEWPVRVEIVTRDGRILTREMDGPLGEPGSYSPEQIYGKFERLAGPSLGGAGVRAVISLTEKLETSSDLRDLLGWLSGGRSRA